MAGSKIGELPTFQSFQRNGAKAESQFYWRTLWVCESLGLKISITSPSVRAMRSAVLIVPLMLIACGNEEEIKKKVAAVQQQADEQASKAKQAAQQKLDELQKQFDQLKTEATESKTKLDECTTKAQASAEEQAKSADAALSVARGAFKSAAKLELAEVNKAINELGPKSAKANAKQKAAFQAALKPVAAQQKTLAADLAAFDTATLDTFKTVKAKFERDLALLKNTKNIAKSKLPP